MNTANIAVSLKIRIELSGLTAKPVAEKKILSNLYMCDCHVGRQIHTYIEILLRRISDRVS
jgi:hypothetical protein